MCWRLENSHICSSYFDSFIYRKVAVGILGRVFLKFYLCFLFISKFRGFSISLLKLIQTSIILLPRNRLTLSVVLFVIWNFESVCQRLLMHRVGSPVEPALLKLFSIPIHRSVPLQIIVTVSSNEFGLLHFARRRIIKLHVLVS